MLLAFTVAALLAQAPTLTLDEALEEAAAHNLDLVAARARLEQAELLNRKAWAAQFPTLSAGGNYTHNSNAASLAFATGYAIRDVGVTWPQDSAALPGKATTLAMVPTGFVESQVQVVDQLGGQLQVQQPFLVPAVWSAIHTSKLAEDVSRSNAAAVRREVLFQTAQLYFAAATWSRSVEVQQQLLESTRAHEADARARYEAGSGQKLALVRARIDRLKAEADVLRAQNSLSASKSALATMLGRETPFELAAPAEPQVPASPEALLQGAATHRVDVRAAQQSEALARAAHDGVWLKYLPNVGLNAAYKLSNSKGFTNSYDSWNVGVSLVWTLWDGGLREAELRESAAKVRETTATRESAELKAKDEVRRALWDLENALANYAKATEQVTLAREQMGLVEASFKAGAANSLEFTDARAALLNAEVGVLTEALNRALASLKVLYAAGVFPR